MRLLIIESNPRTRNILKVGFGGESFAIDTTDNGDHGSYLARTNDYDVILLSSTTTKKDSLTICKEIRSAKNRCVIIVIGNHGELNKKVELLNNGADDFLSKPFSFEELFARVHASLRRSPVTDGSIITACDLTIEPKSQRVIRAKKEIYLTRKEFSMLEYLMRNKGNVVSRGMILEHVWNLEGDPFSNTLETHIFNLRKKIDDAYDKKLIKNVPGRGYRLATV